MIKHYLKKTGNTIIEATLHLRIKFLEKPGASGMNKDKLMTANTGSKTFRLLSMSDKVSKYLNSYKKEVKLLII